MRHSEIENTGFSKSITSKFQWNYESEQVQEDMFEII